MPEREPILGMALVGGGPGAFIGPIRRVAAELKGGIRLVAGVFSRDAGKSTSAAPVVRLNK